MDLWQVDSAGVLPMNLKSRGHIQSLPDGTGPRQAIQCGARGFGANESAVPASAMSPGAPDGGLSL